MRISPVKNFINFTSTERTKYFDEQQNAEYFTEEYDVSALYGHIPGVSIVYSNSTAFFRNDLDFDFHRGGWQWFIRDIEDSFPKDVKVNVYDFACSDGSEPYSLASIIKEWTKKPERFFPILASDNDKEILKVAKGAKLWGDRDDILNIKESMGSNSKLYFDIEENKDGNYTIKPKPIIKKDVRFKAQNFLDGLDKVKTSNSLILCRNFWRYMTQDDIAEAVYKLHKNLDETSRIVIGSYDSYTSSSIPYFFRAYGLKPCADHTNFILKNNPDIAPICELDEITYKKKIKQTVMDEYPKYGK